MGYALERFLGYVNEGLLCCVCMDVLRRPLQAPCEHVYCVSCITFWLNHHKTCPQDRLPLEESQLKPLFRYMRNDLDRLQIRCVNSKKGCDWIGFLEALGAHEDQCHFEDFPEINSDAAQASESELYQGCSHCGNGDGRVGPVVNPQDQPSQQNSAPELRLEIERLRLEESRQELTMALDTLKTQLDRIKDVNMSVHSQITDLL